MPLELQRLTEQQRGAAAIAFSSPQINWEVCYMSEDSEVPVTDYQSPG